MKKTIIIAEDYIKTEREMSLEDCIEHFNDAISKWAYECHLCVKDVSHNVMEFDDFYNEGMICLIKVYKNYKSINTFCTALHKSLDNLRVDLLRRINTKKRKTESTLVSFDMELEDGAFLKDIEGGIDESFSDMELYNDIENALSKLSNEERSIAMFLLNAESTKTLLAEELGMSRPTLNTRIEKVKDKIIDLLPEHIAY